MPTKKDLFDGLPEQSVAKAELGSGKPRMREPERRQVSFGRWISTAFWRRIIRRG